MALSNGFFKSGGGGGGLRRRARPFRPAFAFHGGGGFHGGGFHGGGFRGGGFGGGGFRGGGWAGVRRLEWRRLARRRLGRASRLERRLDRLERRLGLGRSGRSGGSVRLGLGRRLGCQAGAGTTAITPRPSIARPSIPRCFLRRVHVHSRYGWRWAGPLLRSVTDLSARLNRPSRAGFSISIARINAGRRAVQLFR